MGTDVFNGVHWGNPYLVANVLKSVLNLTYLYAITMVTDDVLDGLVFVIGIPYT